VARAAEIGRLWPESWVRLDGDFRQAPPSDFPLFVRNERAAGVPPAAARLVRAMDFLTGLALL
jgi:hypothetical protein